MKNYKFWVAVLLLAIAATITRSIEYQHEAEIQKIENSAPYQSNQPVEKERKPAPDGLDAWINTLASKYECEGCGPNYRRIDSNGLYSYGCLQFQERTFRNAIKIYGLLPGAEAQEYLNQIYDCDFQKEVARAMLLNEPEGCMHWRTSVLRGAGAPPLPAKQCSLLTS